MSGKNPVRRVVVAMSGGVDSSVAAALCVQQGYEVIGVTIKTYRYEDVGGNTGNESTCCSLEGINDARAVAARFGFPHYVLDFSERFGSDVIGNFVDEYLAGRTPNPCVVCNRKIKWEELLVKARALGADAIATGHYARVRFEHPSRRWVLSRGKDGGKDQSYALWALTQDSLSRTIFPLAEMTKGEVRALASDLGLECAAKGESYEICFIPDNNYERFLKEREPDLERQVRGGNIILDGKIVGTHRGYPFYTIGQRKGLGVAFGRPTYVTGIDPLSNAVYVGADDRLMYRELIAGGVNFIKYPECPDSLRVHARIRYKDEGGSAIVSPLDSSHVHVLFDKPRRAITPGQSLVLYEGEDVVGGGVIERALEESANPA